MKTSITFTLKKSLHLSPVILGIFFFFSQATAYKIGSATVGTSFPNIHESITSLAQQCLANSTGRPEGCWQGENPIGNIARDSRELLESNPVAYASRWPDDPTRHLDNDRSQPKFGTLMFTDCQPVLRNDDHIDTAGLLCSSHYGRLQFMHAMESDIDDDTETTRAKILAWAEFAYKVAIDSSLRNSDFCSTVTDDTQVDPIIQPAFEFANSNFCTDRRGTKFFIIPTTFPAWKVSTFFTFTCSNPIDSGECWEKSGATADEVAGNAAIGALLHLVQDSYSQSHVARDHSALEIPVEGTSFESRVVCGPALKYFNYSSQMTTNEEAHDGADFVPALDASCVSSSDRQQSIDEVITASAMVLWHLEQGDVNEFIEYLENSVFPSA